MKKLFLTLLVVAGLITACDKESAWELSQEQRIEELQMTTVDLQAQIDDLKKNINSEIGRVTQLISALRVETNDALANQFELVQEDLSDAVLKLTDAYQSYSDDGDSAALFQAMAWVTEAEDRLTTVLEDNIAEVKSALGSLGVANVDLESSIDQLIIDLTNLNSQLNSDSVDLTELIEGVAQTVADANLAIAANTASISELRTELLGDLSALIQRFNAFETRTETQFDNQVANNIAQEDYINRVINRLIVPLQTSVASNTFDIAANGGSIAQLVIDLGNVIDLSDVVAEIDSRGFVTTDALELRIVDVLAAAAQYADDNDEIGESFDASGLQSQITALADRVAIVEGFEATLTSLQTQIDAIDFVDTDELTAAVSAAQQAAQNYADANDDDTVFDPAGLQTQLDALDTVVADIANLQTQINAIDFVDTDELSTAIEAAIVRANDYADANDDDTVFDATDLQDELNSLSTVVADIADLQDQIDNLGTTYASNADVAGLIEALQRQINIVADNTPEEFDPTALEAAIAELRADLLTLSTSVAALTTTVNELTDVVEAIDFVDTTELQAAIDNVLAQAQAYADNNDDDTVFDPSELQTQLDALSTVVADLANIQAQIDALPDSYIGQEDIDTAVAGLQRQINTLSIENQGDAATLASLQGQINALQAQIDALTPEATTFSDADLALLTDWTVNGFVATRMEWTLTLDDNGRYRLEHSTGRGITVEGQSNTEVAPVFENIDDAFTAINLTEGVIRDEIAAAQLAADRAAAVDADIAGLTLQDGFLLRRSAGDGLQIENPGGDVLHLIDVRFTGTTVTPSYRYEWNSGAGGGRVSDTPSLQSAYDRSIPDPAPTTYTVSGLPSNEPADGGDDSIDNVVTEATGLTNVNSNSDTSFYVENIGNTVSAGDTIVVVYPVSSITRIGESGPRYDYATLSVNTVSINGFTLATGHSNFRNGVDIVDAAGTGQSELFISIYVVE